MLDALAAGLRECNSKPFVGAKLQLNGFLENMLTSRISRRVLAEQHINLHNRRCKCIEGTSASFCSCVTAAGPFLSASCLYDSAASDAVACQEADFCCRFIAELGCKKTVLHITTQALPVSTMTNNAIVRPKVHRSLVQPNHKHHNT